ncbi:MAG: hypothetical protein JXB47_04500 [Anaerolineae bacterium]|nr:hypothetical protein [Anaerolineae bacterium]
MTLIDDSYPCPRCGEYGLVYDGMLAWRSGPRPPRELARKDVTLSARADVEREHCYHCTRCGAEFWQDVEQRSIHLYEEGAGGQYVYSGLFGWQRKTYEAGRPVIRDTFDPPKPRKQKPDG